MEAYKILWMPAGAMPKLVLLRQIPAMRKKFTFKTKRETCPATMAQIQQNIILKKYMWLTLGEIARILSLLNARANHSLSRKVARQYRPSQGVLKTAGGILITPPRRFPMRARHNAQPSPPNHLGAFRFVNRRKHSNNAEKSSHPKRNLYWSQKPHAPWVGDN